MPHHLHPRESVSPNMTYSDYITSMADEGGLQVELPSTYYPSCQ